MRLLCILAVGAALAGSASAQSPLTTQYFRNNGGAPGGCVLFDLVLRTGVQLTAFDVNAPQVPGVAGTLDVFVAASTYLGNETNPSAWSQLASGTCTTAGLDRATRVTLNQPVPLLPGSYGLLLRASSSWSHAYTNATGTNLDWSNAEMTFRAGAAQNVQFGPTFASRVFNGAIHFAALPGHSSTAFVGAGCYRESRSFYEDFDPPGGFDLGNQAMRLVFSGNAYVAVLAGTFVPPGGSATVLPMTDESEVTVPLNGTLVHPGGTTTSLTVCSNGFVSAGPGNGVMVPDAYQWVGSTRPRWGTCHDYDPASGGQITFEQSGNVAIVTWNAVGEPFPTTNPGVSTWQLQFDLSTGNVTYAWQGMSGTGSRHLAGFAAAGYSFDLGNLDLSVLLPNTFATSADDGLPLLLYTGALPVLGTTANWFTSDTRAPVTIGVNVVSFTSFVPGRDLSAVGMPGCLQHVGLDVVLPLVSINGYGASSLALPASPGLAGAVVFSQSWALAPGANALGAITSNGLSLTVDVQ